MDPRQHPVPPAVRRPIVIIGAGGVVRNAHLPAYQLAGFEVVSIFDVDSARAAELSQELSIPFVAGSLSEAIERAPTQCVFDLAVPASQIAATLLALPNSASVLIQKPMGEEIEQARRIRKICREKGLRAAVNFQLRYAPYSLLTRHLTGQGVIGEILEIDVDICVHTPWAMWYFLEHSPRMEIVYHSIHYLDFIRCLLGDPRGVKANTLRHPASPKLHSSRSAIILDYGDKRAQVTTYHAHDYGVRHQASAMRIEGSRGCIKLQMGLNMAYPKGEPDWFEYCSAGSDWQRIELEGSWFPHAFRGTMGSVMNWAADPNAVPETNFEDAFRTMALVEACYRDAESPGTAVAGDE